MTDTKVSAITIDTTPLAKDRLYRLDYASGSPADSASYVGDVASLGALAGVIVNGYISVSVSASDLTVTLLASDGTNPSTTNPVVVKIGNTHRRITAALSVTNNDGTNWFNAGSSELATLPVNYFVYLAWDATNSLVRLGYGRFPYAKTYADFSGTSTDNKYGQFSSGILSTDEVVNVGRFTATLSAGAAYTWSISGTGDVINRPFFETDWLDWNPTFTGFSVSPTTSVHQYRINYKTVDVQVRHGADGTSNASNFILSLPFTAATKTNQLWSNACYVTNSGTAEPGFIFVSSASSTVNFQRLGATAPFTASGGKRANGGLRFALA